MNRVKAKAWKVGRLTFALTAVLVAGWFVVRDGFGPQRVAPDVPAPVVERLGPAPTGEDSGKRYADMVESGKFNAAMAITSSGGYGWADNHARIEEAERIALAHCGQHGPDCRIILRILPETPVALDELPLSRTAAEALAGYPEKPGAKAIALTGHGGWGGAWNRKTRTEAIESALTGCRKHETTTAPGLELTTKCRVIWAD